MHPINLDKTYGALMDMLKRMSLVGVVILGFVYGNYNATSVAEGYTPKNLMNIDSIRKFLFEYSPDDVVEKKKRHDLLSRIIREPNLFSSNSIRLIDSINGKVRELSLLGYSGCVSPIPIVEDDHHENEQGSTVPDERLRDIAEIVGSIVMSRLRAIDVYQLKDKGYFDLTLGQVARIGSMGDDEISSWENLFDLHAVYGRYWFCRKELLSSLEVISKADGARYYDRRKSDSLYARFLDAVEVEKLAGKAIKKFHAENDRILGMVRDAIRGVNDRPSIPELQILSGVTLGVVINIYVICGFLVYVYVLSTLFKVNSIARDERWFVNIVGWHQDGLESMFSNESKTSLPFARYFGWMMLLMPNVVCFIVMYFQDESVQNLNRVAGFVEAVIGDGRPFYDYTETYRISEWVIYGT